MPTEKIHPMNALARLTVLFLATTASIVAFSSLFELFNAFLSLLSSNNNKLSQIGPLGAMYWGAMFRAPGYLLIGTVPLLLIFIGLEFRTKRTGWVYLLIWAAAGTFADAPHFVSFPRALAAILAGLIAGLMFWLLAGRRAGNWRKRTAEATPDKTGRTFGRYGPWNILAYAVLAFLAYQLAGYLVYGGKMLWVSFISEPGAGVPPYTNKRQRDFTVFHKVALLDFPDAKSCLPDDIGELSPENLRKMDWSKIENSAEAEVCGFRLLGSNPDISYATEWFRAQGMTVPDAFSSATPYKDRKGALNVHGSWSIRENGPKFPERGPIRRLFGSIPYSMYVNSTWSPDGKKLEEFDIGFNTL